MARPDGCGDLLRVAGIDERHLHAEASEELPHELARAPVAIARHDHMVAGLEQLEHRGRHRGHAAREEGAVFGSFEGGDLALGRAHGRIAVATVLLALLAAFEVVDDLCRVLEGVGGGADDGRRHRVVSALARLTSADCDRLDPAGHRGHPSRPPRSRAALPFLPTEAPQPSGLG